MNILKQLFHLRHTYEELVELKNEIKEISSKITNINHPNYKHEKVLLGKLIANQNNSRTISNIHDTEFQVFSQFGDDGIIQYLINKLDIENKTFIEFGVENYTESNTRFLLINNNWSGFIIDGDEKNIKFIKKDDIYWLYDLSAKHAFITKESINELFHDLPFNKKVGILSIDIDGNDYWIWKAITEVEADIVIIEYNASFGSENPWTIPYDPTYVRKREFPGMNYFGVSLLSLCDLGIEKGYSFIGCNSSGNNAYFVKTTKLKNIIPLTCKQGFVESKFREVSDLNDNPLPKEERLVSLKGFPIYNTRDDKMMTI